MMSLVIQISWLAVLGVVEIFAMQWQRTAPSLRRRLRNVTFTVVNHVVVPPISVLAVHLLLPVAGIRLVADLPVVLGVVVAVVVFDVAGYWFHRLSHRNLVLWRFHQVHHLDEDFDFTTGARVHTVEETLHHLILVGLAVLLGIPSAYLAVFSTIAFVMALFHHSNIAIPDVVERRLRLIVFTPAMHVPHHHEMIENTDTNFGFIFPWWDRMFGTFNTTSRESDWRIGLDYSRDLGLIRLFVQPFAPTQLKDSSAGRPTADALGDGGARS